MATKNAFETSDTVSLKGDVTGVTRISKRVKVLLVFGALLLLGFICFAIFTLDGSSEPAQKQDSAGIEKDETQKRKGHEPAQADALFEGVGDGNAIAGALNPSFDIATIEKAPGATKLAAASVPESGTPVIVPAITDKFNVAPALPQATTMVPALPPAPSAAELAARRASELREQQRAQALQGEIEISSGWGTGASNAQGAAGSNIFAAGVPSMPTSPATGTGLGLLPPLQPQDDQNKQVRKESFLHEAGSNQDEYYLKELKQQPRSKYELKMGWKIPAFLEDGINSDLPGMTCARVRENVYDSASGKYLLIPQGTKACGTYDSQISIGQNRVLMVWNRLIFPDGSTMNLQGMPGVDQAGYAGYDSEIDNHYVRIFAGALLMSIVSAGAQLSQPPQVGTGATAPSAGQTASAAMGQQLGQVGMALAQRDLKIQPTLTQMPGYRMNIQVTRDMVFTAPYRQK